MYLTVVFVLVSSLQIFGFNIDTNHFIVYVDPQKGENYFGYSVVLYPGIEDFGWINIGAPRAQNPEIDATKPGVVYNCPLMQECKPLDFKLGRLSKSDQLLNNAWIGASMDINYQHRKQVICGFRTIQTQKYDQRAIRRMPGSCYASSSNNGFKQVIVSDRSKITMKTQSLYIFNYAYAQTGFSVHFPKNEDTMLLGAPGVQNWQGAMIKIDTAFENTYTPDIKLKENFQFGLLGYSVNSGYFFGPEKLYYVSGAPKSIDYKGRVILIEFTKNGSPSERLSVVGEQFGEYFGASIASGDLNSDGYDDLIVGAPYHAEETYNEGAVYVFLGRTEGQLSKHQTLYGQQTNGQFGSTLMFLEDLDHDGFGDLAIGAPYEDEFGGVLYIYKGSKEGIDIQPSQKIVGKVISPGIRGFGISISRPADIDENGYKDLLVGAHMSGNAVLLRTRPVVVVQYKIKVISVEKTRNVTELRVNICYWYTDFKGSSIELIITVTAVGISQDVLPKSIIKEWTETLTIGFNETVCRSKTFRLKLLSLPYSVLIKTLYELPDSQNEKEVMYISDNYKNGTDNFCEKCPVLDRYRSTRSQSLIVRPDLRDQKNLSRSNLIIDAKFLDLEDGAFVVGSRDQLNLYITVTNTEEDRQYRDRYYMVVEVALPDIVTLKQLPSECYETVKLYVLCKIKEKTLDLCIDMKKINEDSYMSKLNFTLKILYLASERGFERRRTDEKVLTLPLRRAANIMILGRSGQQSAAHGREENGMEEFNQIYQVDKYGYSPLEKVQVIISIPHSITTPSGEISFIKIYPPQATFTNHQYVSCRSSLMYIAKIQTPDISQIEDYYDSLEGLEDLEAEQPDLDDSVVRRRRLVNVMENDDEIDEKEGGNFIFEEKKYNLVPNKTFFLNCSVKGVMCSNIVCTIGPFGAEQIPAVIEIRMIFDLNAISDLLGDKDLILYSSRGTAAVEIPRIIHRGRRIASVEVSSLFIDKRNKQVALWIVMVAATAGILLLIVIIYGLTKTGFFKRTSHVEIKYTRWVKIATEDFLIAESTPEPILRYIKPTR